MLTSILVLLYSLAGLTLSQAFFECLHSILVRNTEWENIKANLPWLLDAAVCVALDLFVSFSLISHQNILKFFLSIQLFNINFLLTLTLKP